MDLDWTRLGERLRAGRQARGMEQQEVAEALGVKRGALWNIESGKIAKVTRTVRLYAQLVGWTDDSPELVLAGGEPLLADRVSDAAPKPPPRAPLDADDLSLSVKTALKEGPLLDSRVVRVRTPAGEVTATIVARGEDGMSPEEQLEALKAWQALGPVVVDAEPEDAPRA